MGVGVIDFPRTRCTGRRRRGVWTGVQVHRDYVTSNPRSSYSWWTDLPCCPNGIPSFFFWVPSYNVSFLLGTLKISSPDLDPFLFPTKNKKTKKLFPIYQNDLSVLCLHWSLGSRSVSSSVVTVFHGDIWIVDTPLVREPLGHPVVRSFLLQISPLWFPSPLMMTMKKRIE